MNLFLLSKYRTQLMGVATIMIIVCNSVRLSNIKLFFKKYYPIYSTIHSIFFFE